MAENLASMKMYFFDFPSILSIYQNIFLKDKTLKSYLVLNV